jgi:hypothetical protein
MVCRAVAHNVIAFKLVEKEQRFVVAAECLPGRANLSVKGGCQSCDGGNYRTTDAKRRRGGRKKRILESGGSVLV